VGGILSVGGVLVLSGGSNGQDYLRFCEEKAFFERLNWQKTDCHAILWAIFEFTAICWVMEVSNGQERVGY
jgi:hypothetical protein